MLLLTLAGARQAQVPGHASRAVDRAARRRPPLRDAVASRRRHDRRRRVRGAARNGPQIRVSLFAARTLNATDQSRVTLSPRQERLRAGCAPRQEERGPETRPKTRLWQVCVRWRPDLWASGTCPPGAPGSPRAGEAVPAAGAPAGGVQWHSVVLRANEELHPSVVSQSAA